MSTAIFSHFERDLMKLYLDTSVISAFFDTRNPERKTLTEDFFHSSGEFEIFVSELTLAEIEKTPDTELLEKMRDLVSPFNVLELSQEMEILAREYIHQGAVPKAYSEDAYHIAAAVIGDMDYLLSWNFRHIVRNRTRDVVRMVNTMRLLKHIEIITPGELL